MNERELFFKFLAQTSPAPLAIEVEKAEGCYIYDRQGKKYLDLIGGISVANTGHRHPRVLEAIRDQLDKYLHVMVYGEFVESPQVKYAQLICSQLPEGLNSVYFTNSGAEAVEGAMKLAKRVTGRTEIISFHRSYHGSTQGALSLLGDEYWRNAFRPLLPGIRRFDYGDPSMIGEINSNTACVILETIQAESGITAPSVSWLRALRKKCYESGCLLVLDEIQAGFGRTGKFWAFEHFEITPDILLLGKALGGGLPLGAFVSSRENMQLLTKSPVLGHITTFGGHPLSCAAGMASMNLLLEENWIKETIAREKLLKEKLVHTRIRSLSSFGLWMAVELESAEYTLQVVNRCLEKGLIIDWFLFNPQCLRISPPLAITEPQLREAINIILESL